MNEEETSEPSGRDGAGTALTRGRNLSAREAQQEQQAAQERERGGPAGGKEKAAHPRNITETGALRKDRG
jgi:hypothetical protein